MNYDFLVDSHCHLDLLEQKGFNIDEIVENATKNQVKILQTICTSLVSFDNVYKYSQKYENVFASIGIHPNNVDKEPMVKAEQLIKELQEKSKLIGIGETGLDYHYQDSAKETQIDSFLEHIKAARETNLPLIIHSRDADEDMMNILQSEMKKGKFKALLHCFSSGKDLALKAIDLGIYISVPGIITFKNANDLQNIIKEIPNAYLLVETDSPYLAPTPYRGKINQPAYTKNTAEFLANLKGLSFEEICHITTKNFFDLFTNASEI
jgi:TatD DNase family protein